MTSTTEYDGLLKIVEAHTRFDDDSLELPLEISTALQSQGFFSLLLPKAFGGDQMDYPQYVTLVKAFARHNGSAAWCINQGSVLASLARHVDPDIARTIWTDKTVALANGPPVGDCSSEKSEQGYRLTGRWNFCSGYPHADWLIAVSAVMRSNGSKSPVWHLFKRDTADVDKTWNVAGLRQTGSYTFSVTDRFVPKEHAFSNQITGKDVPLYQIPLNLLFAGGFAAVALGISRAAIDFGVQRSKSKIKRFEKDALQHNQAAQDTIGRAEARWQAANSYLFSTINEIWRDTTATVNCSQTSKYALRLAATHTIREAKAVTDLIYDLCSSDSIEQSAPIHRCFQDIHVISQHLQARPEVYGIVGSQMLGAPQKTYLID